MMRPQVFFILLIVSLFCCASYADADADVDLVVIVNPDNKVSQMKKNEVVDLFMGRYVIFPTGVSALPLDQPVTSETRKRFYDLLTGKSVAQVNAYWARLIFTGRASPPRVMPDVETTLRVVRENKDAIAYIPKNDLDSTVKVVLTFDQ
jgi:hypothetical protein